MKSKIRNCPAHRNSGAAPQRLPLRIPASKPKGKNQKPLDADPDNLGDYDAVKELSFDMLRDDHYWHGRIKRILAAAGLVTRRIEQMESHPVWIMHLTRTTFDLAPDQPTAAKQIRKVLCKGGIKILRNELSIVSRSKDWIQCAFVLELGAPGVLN